VCRRPVLWVAWETAAEFVAPPGPIRNGSCTAVDKNCTEVVVVVGKIPAVQTDTALRSHIAAMAKDKPQKSHKRFHLQEVGILASIDHQ
jgi:hypothetical protein